MTWSTDTSWSFFVSAKDVEHPDNLSSRWLGNFKLTVEKCCGERNAFVLDKIGTALFDCGGSA